MYLRHSRCDLVNSSNPSQTPQRIGCSALLSDVMKNDQATACVVVADVLRNQSDSRSKNLPVKSVRAFEEQIIDDIRRRGRAQLMCRKITRQSVAQVAAEQHTVVLRYEFFGSRIGVDHVTIRIEDEHCVRDPFDENIERNRHEIEQLEPYVAVGDYHA